MRQNIAADITKAEQAGKMKSFFKSLLTFCFLLLMASCSSSTPSPQVHQTQVMETAVSAAWTEAIKTQTAPTPTAAPDPEVISLANARGLVLKLMSVGEAFGNAAYSPDGKWLYVPTFTGMYAYDTTSYQNVHSVSGIPAGAFSPSGKILMREGNLFLMEGMQKLLTLELVPKGTNPYASSKTFFSPDESLIAHRSDLPGQDTHNVIGVWRLRDGKLINTFETGDGAISADNRLIAIGRVEQDAIVYLYDLQTGEELGRWPGEHPVFLSDNSLVVGANGYTRILDPVHHKTRRGFAGTQAVFSPDEQAVALWDRQYINVYRVSDGTLLSRFKLELSRVEDIIMRFSPDGQMLAGYAGQRECCAGYSSTLSLWRVSDGALIKKLRPSGNFVFSPDSQTITVGARDVLRTSDGSLIADLQQSCQTSFDPNLVFTPDGQQIIVDCYTVYLYPINGGSPWVGQKVDRETYLPLLKDTSFSGYDQVLSPDGKFMAQRAGDLIVVSSTEEEGKKFSILGTNMIGMTFSPDHEILALGLKDGAVSLWDVNSGRFAYAILHDIHSASRLAFSPDGKSLVLWTDDTLRLYGIDVK
jgi:WD40 repeat protein